MMWDLLISVHLLDVTCLSRPTGNICVNPNVMAVLPGLTWIVHFVGYSDVVANDFVHQQRKELDENNKIFHFGSLWFINSQSLASGSRVNNR